MKPRLRLTPPDLGSLDPWEDGGRSEDRTELEAFVSTRMLWRDGDGQHDRIAAVTLRVLTGNGAGTVKRFTGERIGGGRGIANQMVLDDDAASLTHFELMLGSETVTLRDLGSTNGTWLGTVQVREAIIPEKTVFTIGSTDIELVQVKRLRVPASKTDTFGALRGRSAPMRELFTLLSRVAETDLDFLVQGAPGTGKMAATEAIHQSSRRHRGSLIVFDCSSKPSIDELQHALLGCQSGPTAPFPPDAEGGTLVLRHIEHLPVRLQAELLRAIELRDRARARRSGRRADVRLVFSSSIDPRILVSEGLFHDGFVRKISEVSVRMPSLSDLPNEAVYLLEHALVDIAPERRFRLMPDAVRILSVYPFPGNVGELLDVAANVASQAECGDVNRRHLGLGLDRTGGVDDLAELPFADAKSQFALRYYSALENRFLGQVERIAAHASVSMATVRRALPHLFGRRG